MQLFTTRTEDLLIVMMSATGNPRQKSFAGLTAILSLLSCLAGKPDFMTVGSKVLKLLMIIGRGVFLVLNNPCGGLGETGQVSPMGEVFMCKCQQNVALALYNEKGGIEFQHWYSTVASARAVKSKLSYRFRPGYTWVMWTFDTAGNKLLLSSSRPLKFEWVKQSDLI